MAFSCFCWSLKESLVAVGDVHGDLSKTFISLELAGVCKQINQRAVWCGGDTTVVQLGDVLDRGDQEIGVGKRLHSHHLAKILGYQISCLIALCLFSRGTCSV